MLGFNPTTSIATVKDADDGEIAALVAETPELKDFAKILAEFTRDVSEDARPQQLGELTHEFIAFVTAHKHHRWDWIIEEFTTTKRFEAEDRCEQQARKAKRQQHVGRPQLFT